MKFNLEELYRANDNGSLESLLLGHGVLPLEALKSCLQESQEVVENLEGKVEYLRDYLEWLDLEDDY